MCDYVRQASECVPLGGLPYAGVQMSRAEQRNSPELQTLTDELLR